MAASDIVVLDSNGEVSKVALTKDVVASPDEEEGPAEKPRQTVVTPSGVMHVPFMTYSKEGSTSKSQSDTTITSGRGLSPGATDSTVESVEVLEEGEEDPSSEEFPIIPTGNQYTASTRWRHVIGINSNHSPR